MVIRALILVGGACRQAGIGQEGSAERGPGAGREQPQNGAQRLRAGADHAAAPGRGAHEGDGAGAPPSIPPLLSQLAKMRWCRSPPLCPISY